MKRHGSSYGIPHINRSDPAQLENIAGMHNADPVLPYVPIFPEQSQICFYRRFSNFKNTVIGTSTFRKMG